MIFCQQELHSAIMFCRNYLQFNGQFWYFVLFCRSALLCRFNIPMCCWVLYVQGGPKTGPQTHDDNCQFLTDLYYGCDNCYVWNSIGDQSEAQSRFGNFCTVIADIILALTLKLRFSFRKASWWDWESCFDKSAVFVQYNVWLGCFCGLTGLVFKLLVPCP